MDRTAQLVLGVVLLLLVFVAATLTSIVTAAYHAPAMLIVTPVLLVPVAAATLEVAGRPAHLLGLAATGPLLIVILLGFASSPVPDMRWLVALVQWLLAATVWGTVGFILRPASAAAAPEPETAL